MTARVVAEPIILGMELRAAALRVLTLADPAAKVAAVRELTATPSAWLDPRATPQPTGPLPGRPARPRLVAPAKVPRRTPFAVEGRSALLHAVAHIEFNAIKTFL